MKYPRLAIAFYVVMASSAAIGQATRSHENADESAAVLSELSRRSALPESELTQLLANCGANQMSMNICAWRDEMVAERELKKVVAEKISRVPECGASIESKVAAWEHVRDSGCEKSATKDYDDGSIKPMAQAMCMKDETVKMTKRVKRIKKC